MTIGCHDSDDIPRVKDAGDIKKVNGEAVQVMHNGLLVKRGAYQGDWQARTIKALRGTHEPQEEKVFYEVLKRVPKDGTMIELGSWWSYYSMWFVKSVDNGKAICCEPDPNNIEVGKFNSRLNNLYDRMTFVSSAAGQEDHKLIEFETESKEKVRVPIRTVDSLIQEHNVSKLDVLHMDIQGAEVSALEGARRSIESGKLRFVFISTHHHAISNDPRTHQKCLDFIHKHGGHIIAKHTVLESCSGDGLIVASFDPKDKDFQVRVTLQPSDESFFRPLEEEVAILWDAKNELKAHTEEVEEDLHNKTDEFNYKETELKGTIEHLNQRIHYFETRSLKTRVKEDFRYALGRVKSGLRPK